MTYGARLALCGLLTVIAGSTAAAQQRTASSTDAVIAMISRYDQAWNTRDTATVRKLLAPNYLYFSSMGELTPRGETLEFLSSPDYRLEHAHRSEIQVRVSGPVAVASTRWQGRGSYKGESFTDDQRCSLVWLKAATDWQLVTEHCTQIARKPAQPD